MINVLVTGSKGQLGLSIASLENSFPELKLFLTDKENIDIVNFIEVETFIVKNKIDAIINCAAYTNVEKAELEKDEAENVNFLAVKNLAGLAKKHQIKLIHISTDYVFDGNSMKPCTEGDGTNPQNEYGKSKLKGEIELLTVNPKNSLIIRTSWLYSEYGSNFVKTILSLSKKNDVVNVVSDQFGSPTYAFDLAKVILKVIPLVNNNSVEVFHYSNKGTCSWFEFANEIIKLSGINCTVNPISSSEFNSKVKRPKYSLLNTEKIQTSFGLNIPYWEDSLKECIDKIKEV